MTKPPPPADESCTASEQPDDLQSAELSWQEDGAPFSSRYGDVYFSRSGGLDETRHVFLDGNHLQQRWQALDSQPDAGVFTIAELGFGTGLNFLSCWRLWQQTACRRLRLHFISCEKHPISLASLQRALAQWPALADLSAELIGQYPDHTSGYHRLIFAGINNTSELILDLYYGDALAMLQQQSSAQARVDAWFLDGFSPELNPELWSDALLETIARLCRPGSTLSSYSVTGRVVRALRALGFDVEKRKGFGPKRHMLFARFNPAAASASESQAQAQAQSQTQTQTQTHTPSTETAALSAIRQTRRPVLIIGAGLAGATLAWSLARRGIAVTVLEQAEEIASAASGNRQAIVQLRLNKQIDNWYQFHLHSYLYALRFYRHLQQQPSDSGFQWHDCGVLTLVSAYTFRNADGNSYGHYPAQVLQAVDAAQVQAITGLDLAEAGLWQAAGGWINPRLCCRQCLDHELITVRTGTRALALLQTSQGWHIDVEDSTGNRERLNADEVVIANSHSARQFEQTSQLPVVPLRGQVSHVPASARSRQLRQVICSQRYLAPAGPEGEHCVGASYVKNVVDTALSSEEHQENLQKLGAVATLAQLPQDSPEAGRAAIRGASRDYMPIAGQVLEGLYITTGHGSHGTVSCPLVAEHIAALITQQASPLPRALAQLIDPARFVIRELRRQKPGLKPGRLTQSGSAES